MEQTLVVFKPDAMNRGVIGEIITRFEKVGYLFRSFNVGEVQFSDLHKRTRDWRNETTLDRETLRKQIKFRHGNFNYTEQVLDSLVYLIGVLRGNPASYSNSNAGELKGIIQVSLAVMKENDMDFSETIDFIKASFGK